MKVMLANLVATWAHRGQRRKLDKEAYVQHPRRVAKMARAIGLDKNVQAAALLHDVLEDTDFPEDRLRRWFGEETFWLVVELTDQFTPENYPHLNRAKRKVREAERLAIVSRPARVLKLLDVLDNLATYLTVPSDGFGRVFGLEAMHLARKLGDTNDALGWTVHAVAAEIVKMSLEREHARIQKDGEAGG